MIRGRRLSGNPPLASMKARATWWLESPRTIERLIGTGPITIEYLKRGGHARKLLVSSETARFVCLVSLRSRPLERLRTLLSHLESRGVGVQPLVASKLTLAGFLRTRAFCLVLGYVEGELAAGVRSDAELGAIAANLARLHAIAADRSDMWARNRVGPMPKRDLVPRSAVLLHELIAAGVLEGNGSQSWLATLEEVPDSSLCGRMIHGHPHGGNIVLANGRAFWIDTEDLGSGCAGVELAECLLATYCGMDRARQMTFLDAYLGAADPALTNSLSQWGAMLGSLALLKRIVRMRGHVARARASGDASLAARWEVALDHHARWLDHFFAATERRGPWDDFWRHAPGFASDHGFFPVAY